MRKWLCVAGAVIMTLLMALPALGEDAYSAWLPYWEISDSTLEAEMLEGRLDTVIAFEALLDLQDRPFLLDQARDLLLLLTERYANTYTRVLLSVVNDVEIGLNQYENKTVQPLQRIFDSEESMNLHISRLLTLVDTYDLAGIELDYENLKSDVELWEQYAVFIEKLYTKLSAEGLALRVVLSWDTPMYVTLPAGPEYSVMCYNLYGYHSGPGPKADFEFLEQTAQLYKDVPGRVAMAFATGGFDWMDGRVSASLTQIQAQELLEDNGATATRDEASGALTAVYTDEAGAEHTLWYADATTLRLWCDAMRSHGFTAFDFFRLGGNDLSDWEENLF